MKPIAFLSVVAMVIGACSGSSSEGSSSEPSPALPASSLASPSTAVSPARLDKGVKMITDPMGDPVPEVPGYLDTVAAGVAQGWGVFAFAFEVAEPIPASFDVPMGYDAALWSFCLDTDPSSAPQGYPFVAVGPVPCDFIVLATSEGGAVAGTLIDRRPLAGGGDVRTRSIRVFTDGPQGRLVVPDRWLGGRHTSFDWVMATSLITLPFPNDDFIDLDEVEHRYAG